MEPQTLLPDPSCFHLEYICCSVNALTLVITSVQTRVCCPLCGQTFERFHSQYARTLADLPWNQVTITLRVRVRKFFCDNRRCQRAIFTEPLPSLAKRYARKTQRLSDILVHLTYLLGGEAAARIARLV